MKTERIAVIGAGLAGLTAASRLADGGHEVRVFDKSRGVGGRLATRRRFPDDFDHGAQYFTARDPEFRAQVTRWQGEGVVEAWDVPIAHLGGAPRAREPNEPPVRWVGAPRMTAAPKVLAAALDVELSTRITRLERGDAKRWILVAEDERRFEGFSQVVVAAPAPQAVPLLESSPELAAIAAGISMLPCHAAMIRFERPVDADFDGAFVADERLAWAARNRSKPGRPDGEAWVLHSTPAFSQAHLEAEPASLAEALLEAFAERLGRRLPPVRSTDVHRWLLARAERFVGQPYLHDEAKGLSVCGDWLLGDRVECAYRSGAALAGFLSGYMRRG